jgi:WD40 repeat protein
MQILFPSFSMTRRYSPKQRYHYEFEECITTNATSLVYIQHEKFITTKNQLIVGDQKMQIHDDTITRIQKHQDQGLFTTSSLDKSLKVFDPVQLECVYEFKMNEKIFNHALQDSICSLCSLSKSIRLADLKSGSMIQQLYSSSPIVCMDWSPARDYLLLGGCEDGSVCLWDIRKANAMIMKKNVSSHRIHSVLFDHLEFFSCGKELLYWNSLSFNLIRTIPIKHQNPNRFVVPCIVDNVLYHPSTTGIAVYKHELQYELIGHLKSSFLIVEHEMNLTSLSSDSIIDWKPSGDKIQAIQDNWD